MYDVRVKIHTFTSPRYVFYIYVCSEENAHNASLEQYQHRKLQPLRV